MELEENVTASVNTLKTDVNTIIISDIHLGSEVARPGQSRRILK